MTEKPLYQDERLEIDYLPSSPEDHLLYITQTKKGEKLCYIISRGILEELARTPREGIERIIDNFNPNILSIIKKEGIGIDGLHAALCQAHREEEYRVNEERKILD